MFTRKVILSVIVNSLIFIGIIFLPAGTLAWGRAWVFMGMVLLGSVWTMFYVFPGNEGLLAERLKPPIQKDQPLADKIVVSFFIAAFFGQIMFSSYDTFHGRLLGRPGPLVSSLGLVLVMVGWWIISAALRANAFAAPVVRHQAERQQRVIDTGVYAIVRHPMYAGLIPFTVGVALWLESYAGTLATLIPLAILIVRILVEENFLKKELAGYEDYTKRVRYRLIPFIW